jgi:hypothetical protein
MEITGACLSHATQLSALSHATQLSAKNRPRMDTTGEEKPSMPKRDMAQNSWKRAEKQRIERRPQEWQLIESGGEPLRKPQAPAGTERTK